MSSKLVFGCASVMGKVGRRRALRAMESAYASGITHFDVARSYGFGRAEEVVGEFLKGKGGKVTVTTKFGIRPPELGFVLRTTLPLARIARRALAPLRPVAAQASAQLLADRDYSVAYARVCLERSLKELRLDQIDTYLVHEPPRTALAQKSEVVGFLEDAVRAGSIRRWGWAHVEAPDAGLTQGTGAVVQIEGNLLTIRQWRTLVDAGEKRELFATRPFAGGSVGRLSDALNEHPLLADRLRDCGISPMEFSLAVALTMVGSRGKVVCASFDEAHIQRNLVLEERVHRGDEVAVMARDFWTAAAT